MAKNIYREVESPIVQFHKINNDFIEKLSKILFTEDKYYDKYHLLDDDQKDYIVKINKFTANNLIIFENENINILGKFRLTFQNNEMKLKIVGGTIDSKNIIYLTRITDNWGDIAILYYQYYTLYHRISRGYDCIPNKFINELLMKFKNNDKQFFRENRFILPFKHRLTSNFPYMKRKLNEYELFIGFNLENKTSNINFSVYLIKGCDSKTANESSLIVNQEIFRPEEIDKIGRGNIVPTEINDFVQELFIYGNIKNIIECQ